MGWLMSNIYDRFMRPMERARLGPWRTELLTELRGEVLEIGSGTGANLAHYGSGLERLVLSEPDRHMRRKLSARVARLDRALPIEIVDAPGRSLPFADESFDAVVSTLVLCSIADPGDALREMHRVLRPGGALIYIEHVAGPEGSRIHRYQRFLEPLWKILAEGCHVTRRTEELIERAGFVFTDHTADVSESGPVILRPTIRGRAHKPSS